MGFTIIFKTSGQKGPYAIIGMDTGTQEVSREVAQCATADSRRNNAPIDPAILADLKRYYSDVEVAYIVEHLDDSKLRVIHEEAWTEPQDYLFNAWIESMSADELEGFHYYNPSDEFHHHYFEHKNRFLKREENFIWLNLTRIFGRTPLEEEVRDAFVVELTQPGKSISAKCRALYAMKYPENVQYVGRTRPLVPSTLDSAVNAADRYVDLSRLAEAA